VLCGHWGRQSADPTKTALRDELLAWAEQDQDVRRWIARAWQQAHPNVVAAADHAVTEGLAPGSVRMLEAFAAEQILLALLTDEFGNGCELAFSFVNQVGNDNQRRTLLTVLRSLIGGDGTTCRPQARVVILGGNSRDESRLRRRLFENCWFDVRWKTFEKKQGGAAIEKDVVNTLRHADATIIVTGTASHILVQLGKECAQRFGVAWTCIDKASYKQVAAALELLFPMRPPADQRPFDST
jgi:hypothetical protein